MENQQPLIAHIIHSFGMGGLENGLVNLINQIPADKYRHAIICLKQSSDFSQRIQRKDVQIIELNKREGQDWSSFLKLYKVLKQIRPDIVHTRNLATLEYQIIACLCGVKGRVHGEHGWEVYDPDGTNTKYQWLRKLLNPFVKCFIPLSVHLELYLTETVGISSNKIYRICNGVDTSKFYPLTNQKKSLPNYPLDFNDKIIIGTVGRMHGVKDQITLVNAFIKLMKDNPGLVNKIILIIIGDGPLKVKAEKLLTNNHLENCSWLPGKRDDIAEILRCLDIFVLPSQAEGISNTILEAMSTGLPVVATRVGGNPELIKDGLTGSLVEKENAPAMAASLFKYVDDPSTRKQQGNNAREHIMKEFSLQGMVQNYLKVYDSLITPKL